MTRHPMMTRTTVAAITVGLFGFHSICHAVVVINADPNPPQNAPFVSQSEVYGDMMTGMTVTAHFSNAPSETVPWLPTSNVQEGHASGAAGNWKLSQAGDTYSDPWTLKYLGHQNGFLTGLTLDGMAAGRLRNQVVFDRKKDHSGDTHGTPGSFLGTEFSTTPDPYPHFDIHVTYKGEVAVSSSPNAYGDIYRFLDIRFGSGDDTPGHTRPIGLDGYDINTLVFVQDTDRLAKVPEPSTLAMGALGIGMMAIRRRRLGRPIG